MIWKATLVFLAVTVLNFLWAAYISHTSKGNVLHASLYAFAISLLSGIVTLTYASDHMMVIPAAFGAFVGTYLCLKYKKV